MQNNGMIALQIVPFQNSQHSTSKLKFKIFLSI